MNDHRTVFEGEMSRAWSMFTCPIDHPTVMFRKRFFFDNDLFYDETRSHAEDWELWIRAFQKGMVVGCLHEELTYHRWRGGSAGRDEKTDEAMCDLVYENFLRLGVKIQRESLPIVGPWKGKLDDAELERLGKIFEEALSKNAMLNLYDQRSLHKAFSLREKEAWTGVMPEIWHPLSGGETPVPHYEPGKSSGRWRLALKRFLQPLYRPFKRRYEDRIIRTEQRTEEIQNALVALSSSIDELKNQNAELLRNFANMDIHRIELSGRVEKSTLALDALREATDNIARRTNEANSNVNRLFKEMFERVSAVNDRTGERIDGTDANVNRLFKEMFEHVSSVGDRTGERIDGVARDSNRLFQQRMEPLHRSLELRRTRYATEKKILLLGTPGHSNIGDAAIAAGEYEFVKRYFPEYTLIEIDAYRIDAKYVFLQSIVGADDLFFLHGGGNLGDLYPAEELIRRRVIADFPNNRIVVLPQTIYFGDSEQSKIELAVSREIYNRHKDLILFTRGKSSLAFAREHFQNVKSFDALDMAMLLRREFNLEREGILACIRDANDESGIDDDMREDIRRIVERFDAHFEKANNLYRENISSGMRNAAINEELKKFARHKIAVTDRLHGMLFSVMTQTPCVVISAKTQKIGEFYAYFEDSDAVFFIDKDISKLESAIASALAVKTPRYPVLERRLFDEMREIIRFQKVEQNG